MAKRLLLVAWCAVVISAAPACAHEGQPHIMGTVESVNASTLVVETESGKTVSILLTAATTYRDISGTVVTNVDLEPGARVVVDVASKDGSLTATQVRFSSAAKRVREEEGRHHHVETP